MLFVVIFSRKHILLVKNNVNKDLKDYLALCYASFDHDFFSWNHTSRCVATTLVVTGYAMEIIKKNLRVNVIF